MIKRDQAGFSIGELFIAMVIVCALTFGGVKVASNIQEANEEKANNTETSQAHEPTSKVVQWSFDMKASKWTATGTVPECSVPLLKQSPADLSGATAILYPGQYRTDYKPHGGILYGNSRPDSVSVYAPMDARLMNITRYIEVGELQYVMTFINDCGIMYRFDHLATLTPKFQQLANETPEPTESTASNFTFTPAPYVAAGERVATAVGFRSLNRAGFDFGVYDLRQPNDISKNVSWAKQHAQYASQTWFGACWLDMLPADDKAKAWALPGGDQKSKNISDYCKTSGGTTLE